MKPTYSHQKHFDDDDDDDDGGVDDAAAFHVVRLSPLKLKCHGIALH